MFWFCGLDSGTGIYINFVAEFKINNQRKLFSGNGEK
jgi:hypothetical protein